MNLEFACPLCSADNYSLLHATKGGFTSFNGKKADFYICDGCGLVLKHPRPSKSELLDMFYAVEYWQARNISCNQLFQADSKSTKKLEIILQTMGKIERDEVVADIGCGFGSFTTAAANLLPDCKIIGIEPSIELCQALQNCNKQKNVEIINGRLEKLPPQLLGKVKMAFLVTVFEHIFEPVTALQKLHRLLTPDGYLVIDIPDVMETGNLGLDYYFRDFHLFYYSSQTLSTMLEKCGFEVVSVQRGGTFKATTPMLCVVAKKVTQARLDSFKPDEAREEAQRIKQHIFTAANQMKYSGPLNYIYRFKVRKPFLKWKHSVRTLQKKYIKF